MRTPGLARCGSDGSLAELMLRIYWHGGEGVDEMQNKTIFSCSWGFRLSLAKRVLTELGHHWLDTYSQFTHHLLTTLVLSGFSKTWSPLAHHLLTIYSTLTHHSLTTLVLASFSRTWSPLAHHLLTAYSRLTYH